jgi:hypothetical protein
VAGRDSIALEELSQTCVFVGELFHRRLEAGEVFCLALSEGALGLERARGLKREVWTPPATHGCTVRLEEEEEEVVVMVVVARRRG